MTFGKLMLHPAVQATGYALLQFVWQDALMAALLILAGRLIRGSPRLRYALGCLALFSMPLVLGVTILRSYPHQRASVESAVAARRAGGAISVATEDSSGNSRIGRDAEFGSGTSPFLMSEAPITGWVACFWFAGIVTLSLRLAGGWARAQRLRTRDTEPAGEIWSSRLSGLARRLKVSRPVQLYLSARTGSHPASRLPGQSDADRRGDHPLLSSGGLVGEPLDPPGTGALL